MVDFLAATINDDPYDFLTTILAALLVLLPIIGLAGTVFLWRVYRSDINRPRSWVLFRLSVGSTCVEIASFAVAWLALRRLLGSPALAEGASILGLVVVSLEVIPIWYAYSIWSRRRNGESDDGHTHE